MKHNIGRVVVLKYPPAELVKKAYPTNYTVLTLPNIYTVEVT